MPLYKQVGLFLIWKQPKNELRGFAGSPATCDKGAENEDRVRERKAKLSALIENIVIAGAGQAGGRAAEALRAHSHGNAARTRFRRQKTAPVVYRPGRLDRDSHRTIPA